MSDGRLSADRIEQDTAAAGRAIVLWSRVEKLCPQCGTAKIRRTGFRRRRRTADGFHAICMQCRRDSCRPATERGPCPPREIVCCVCGVSKKADTENFVPRSDNVTGFCGTCRKCSKAQRSEAHRRRVRNAVLAKEGKKECIRCGDAKLINQFRTGNSGKPRNVCKPCSYKRTQVLSHRREELDALKRDLGIDVQSSNAQVAEAIADREAAKDENARARDREAKVITAEEQAIMLSGWSTLNRVSYRSPLYRTEDGERSIPVDTISFWESRDKLRLIRREDISVPELIGLFDNAWRYITKVPISPEPRPFIEPVDELDSRSSGRSPGATDPRPELLSAG